MWPVRSFCDEQKTVGQRPILLRKHRPMNSTATAEVADEINAQILAISEDQLQGFQRDPFGVVAERTGLDQAVVLERVRAMLEAGVIRRVRQTLLATNLQRARWWRGRWIRTNWMRRLITCFRRIRFPVTW